MAIVEVKSELGNKIDDIRNMKENGVFKNYIEYIQFPSYKNMERGTRINFSYPITVLIGKNGAGKSSTLHALYGSPKGKTCSDFWFSTDVDPIVDGDGDRARYFYGYKNDKNDPVKEVLMSRIKRSGTDKKKEDPDYWETDRPKARDGMLIENQIEGSSTRNKPVEKDVIYIDFRAEVSAFDKLLFFSNGDLADNKNRIRSRSKYLKRAFDEQPIKMPGNRSFRLSEPLEQLTPSVIKKVESILGKEYSKIKVLDHRIYGVNGTSVLFSISDDKGYSEANAGSGEIAVVQLVRKIEKAKDYTLVLLDEPEVSLHPAAQRHLQEYLIDVCYRKKLQIVISTHSPALIDNLPNDAIKLYQMVDDSKKFKVLEDISYEEAFYDVEEKVHDRKFIYCEDLSAKLLIEKVLKDMGIFELYSVMFFAGGESTLLKYYVPTIVNNEKLRGKVFCIIDGDKDNGYNIELEKVSRENDKSIEFWKTEAHNAFDMDINICVDGNSKGEHRDDQAIEQYRQCLQYYKNNIFYLPSKKIPEEIILKCRYVKKNYRDILEKHGNKIDAHNAKSIMYDICTKEYEVVDGGIYEANLRMILNKWAGEKNTEYRALEKILQTIHGKKSDT